MNPIPGGAAGLRTEIRRATWSLFGDVEREPARAHRAANLRCATGAVACTAARAPARKRPKAYAGAGVPTGSMVLTRQSYWQTGEKPARYSAVYAAWSGRATDALLRSYPPEPGLGSAV